MLVPRTVHVKGLHFQTEFLPVPDNHADIGFSAPCFRVMGILLLEMIFQSPCTVWFALIVIFYYLTLKLNLSLDYFKIRSKT